MTDHVMPLFGQVLCAAFYFIVCYKGIRDGPNFTVFMLEVSDVKTLLSHKIQFCNFGG